MVLSYCDTCGAVHDGSDNCEFNYIESVRYIFFVSAGWGVVCLLKGS